METRNPPIVALTIKVWLITQTNFGFLSLISIFSLSFYRSIRLWVPLKILVEKWVGSWKRLVSSSTELTHTACHLLTRTQLEQAVSWHPLPCTATCNSFGEALLGHLIPWQLVFYDVPLTCFYANAVLLFIMPFLSWIGRGLIASVVFLNTSKIILIKQPCGIFDLFSNAVSL